MKNLKIVLGLGLILHCFTTTIAQPNMRFADSLRKAFRIPELCYAVVTASSTLETAVLGKHSAALPDTATLADRFHLGSNTKALTAFMIARYVEKGKLRWDTEFFDVFPGWKKQANAAYYHITLRDLLTHRARIQPFMGEGDPEIPHFEGTRQEKRKQFARFVLTLQPVDAGNKNTFTYSNAGYSLAALMLEEVTGKSWEQLVDDVFNKDLGLSVQLSWPENQHRKDTWGHFLQNDSLVPVPSTTDYQLEFTEPSGDINITLEDYIKFIQLNLRGLKGENNYLKADTYKYLHEGVNDYAYGWYNIYEDGKSYSTHSGTALTYFALVQIDRIKGVAYIILTNAYSDDTQLGVRYLMRKLKENYGT